ncbi:hypothetical protein HJC23_004056 [Cyclotella cryptica]|uniref:Uncharacterized protein n=1 Tax=Cyclotella cryptica TaxID=29204 RepID=A0ABD3QVH7_9STRA|eukprot:CCRYP_002065-RA/>CCRYP_002065-RA protein AED:0.26 eAED:0.26 QI:0/-1/0/1/-1/1/1/0/108
MSIPSAVSALDFDMFEKGEIAADTKNCNPKLDPECQPKLSPGEALCQYGNSGKARAEACGRVRDAGGKRPEVKKERSLGVLMRCNPNNLGTMRYILSESGVPQVPYDL